MTEKIWFLKRSDLFDRLTAAERSRLEQRSTVRCFRRSEIIYFPGDPGQSVLVLAQGLVKIKALSQDGKETILAFINEGELFGELALVDDEPRSEYAEAAADARIIAIPREELRLLMEQRPEIALYITRLVGLRRRRIENRLQNVLFRSVRVRLVALLLELLESHGQRNDGAWEIGLRLSHQELANLIGATRETVTATLGRFHAEGTIEIRRRRIIVLHRERLQTELKGAGKDASKTAPVRGRPWIPVR